MEEKWHTIKRIFILNSGILRIKNIDFFAFIGFDLKTEVNTLDECSEDEMVGWHHQLYGLMEFE